MNKKQIKLNRTDLVRYKKEVPTNQITLYDFKRESMDLTEAYLAYTVVFEDEGKTKLLKSRF